MREEEEVLAWVTLRTGLGGECMHYMTRPEEIDVGMIVRPLVRTDCGLLDEDLEVLSKQVVLREDEDENLIISGLINGWREVPSGRRAAHRAMREEASRVGA